MRRLLIWSERGWKHRLAMMAGLLIVSAGAGWVISAVGGVTAVMVGLLVASIVLLLMVATLPTYPPPRWIDEQRQVAPNRLRPAPCALCGYDCIPGGCWTPVPGYLNVLMHTMACGPTLPGEQPLADPTHRRELDGRYMPIV